MIFLILKTFSICGVGYGQILSLLILIKTEYRFNLSTNPALDAKFWTRYSCRDEVNANSFL
ncbi:hypothetical protein LEP1GSC043_4216 [Leptospira weilii str. Ecochallenge]|uniref:Uncharacterized protein n=1 Tax=Leptospira weilii str. Ecochallenge TaxID=1049986 RepID=N1U764_9LEPT|nr:hypothetical protein LEP1GSC043_4216 [Leptospira weilii str. Ecochallenge]